MNFLLYKFSKFLTPLTSIGYDMYWDKGEILLTGGDRYYPLPGYGVGCSNEKLSGFGGQGENSGTAFALCGGREDKGSESDENRH